MRINPSEYLYNASPEELEAIRTKPGITSDGKSFDWYVQEEVRRGRLRRECIRPDVLGLNRPLEIFRAVRKTNLIKPWPALDDADTYCPAHWADLAIGCGACGFRCRACFLTLTHRIKCDPSCPVVYENVEDYQVATRLWLMMPDRRNLGMGIDSNDSLLYEGVTGHVRRLAPLFASPKTNPQGCKLVLLTKSTNMRYLEKVPPENILTTFSLNPEAVADLWEGKFSDGTRVTPTIAERLNASLRAQEMGFEVRWRIDPVIPCEGWQDIYATFLSAAVRDGHKPTRITLGTYRETQPALRAFSRLWGLPAMEWEPSGLEHDGAHYHLPKHQRMEIYSHLLSTIRAAWYGVGAPVVALCKEPRDLRRELGLDHNMCNCG
jgi:DNA repair photolyase